MAQIKEQHEELFSTFMKLDLVSERKESRYEYPKFTESWDWLMFVVKAFIHIPTETFNYDAKKMSELILRKEEVSNITIDVSLEIVVEIMAKHVRWFLNASPPPMLQQHGLTVEKFFEDQKGITVDAARISGARYTAIDICKFAKSFHEAQSKIK